MIKKATQNNPVMHLRNSNFKDETKKDIVLSCIKKLQLNQTNKIKITIEKNLDLSSLEFRPASRKSQRFITKSQPAIMNILINHNKSCSVIMKINLNFWPK